MTNALRAFRIRIRTFVRRPPWDAGLLREGWPASRGLLGLYYAGLVTLLSSAASWEIGAPHHNLWIKYAVAGGAILIMAQMRHLQQRTLAAVGRVAHTPLWTV